MMNLARAGIGVAIAGGIALAVHWYAFGQAGAAPVRPHPLRHAFGQAGAAASDCAAWEAAREADPEATPALTQWIETEFERQIVTNALDDPDMQSLWRARLSLFWRPQLLALLLPALRDPSFVGLRDAGNVTVEGRNMPSHDDGMIVREDLFTRAGRASWLLKQATGDPVSIVGVQTGSRGCSSISPMTGKPGSLVWTAATRASQPSCAAGADR